MKAIVVKQPGPAKMLALKQQPKPVPKAHELLIKVKATAVNRTDIINRRSQSGYLKHPILGVEVAGIVEETEPGSNIEVGMRVMGIVNGGGYAEYAVLPVERAMIIPENLSFIEAAAIPEVFLTAYQTLFWHGRLQEGETALIHAGGSGVGTAAIQLAKQLAKAHIIITAGTQAKLDFGKKLGADVGINYKEQVFDDVVLKATDNAGVDVILDFIGASYWSKNMSSIKVDGRWVLIGLLGGAKMDHVNLSELMAKRIQLTGTLLTPRSDTYKAQLTQAFFNDTRELFESGQLKPIVDRTFTLPDMQQAHEYMEQNHNIGKIVVTIDNI